MPSDGLLVHSHAFVATAATLNFIMLASPQGMGEALLILAFSVDTAVSAVILALLVIVSKRYGTSDLSKIVAKMQEKAEVEESEVEA